MPRPDGSLTEREVRELGIGAARLAEHYAEPPARESGELRRARKQGAGFKPDEQMERLAVLRDSQPQTFASLGPSRRISLGLYERGKQASEQLRAASLGRPLEQLKQLTALREARPDAYELLPAADHAAVEAYLAESGTS